MSRHRLRNPELIHGDYQATSFGAVSARDLERARAEEIVFRGRAPKPVLTGSWANGEAGRNLARILADLGIIDDQSYAGDLPGLGGSGASPSFAATANAGTGASASNSSGTDRTGFIVVSGGTGASAGGIVTVTFAVPRADVNYGVHLTPQTSGASSMPGARYTNRSVTGFTLAVDGALVNGTSYAWHYTVEGND